MIRPLTLVTMVAAMGAGLHVYQTKHAVAQLDKELRGIARQIEDQNERSLALSAEWAWLNEPERLRQAANRHLALEPMMPTQFVRFAEFERRLPQVAAWDGPPALFAARDQRGAVQEPNGATRLELAERPMPARTVVLAVPAAAPTTAASARAPDGTDGAPSSVRTATSVTTASPPLPAPEPPRPAIAEAARPDAAPAPALAALAGVAVGAAAAAPARAEPTQRPAPAARPRVVSRPAQEHASLPPVAGPARMAEPVIQGPARVAEVPRVPAMVRTPSPSPALAAAVPTAQPAGSLLGGGTRTALAPPVPYGALPPPVPFASASAAR